MFYTVGSPQQLRDKYGSGYTLTIKAREFEDFHQILLQNFPNIRRLQNKQEGYYTLQIPKQEFEFYKAFRVCEVDLKQKGLIQDFSLRQSSLEQVFLFFSKYQINKDTEDNQINLSSDNVSQNANKVGLKIKIFFPFQNCLLFYFILFYFNLGNVNVGLTIKT